MLLLTGATGYVGGRLLRRLEEEGLPVRCLCRDPEALRWRVAPGTELVRGDLLQPASLDSAFSGVDTAFYLVHSMNSGAGFEANEAASAANFALAANKRRSAPHHLSGRAGLRRASFASYAQPVGDRQHPALRRDSGAGIPGLGDYRFGERIL